MFHMFNLMEFHDNFNSYLASSLVKQVHWKYVTLSSSNSSSLESGYN